MPTYPHHSCKLEIRRFEPQHPDKVPPGPPYLRLRTRTRTPTVVRARPAAHGRTPCPWAFVTCPERTQPNPKLQHLYVHVHAQLGPVLTQLFQTYNLVPVSQSSTWQASPALASRRKPTRALGNESCSRNIPPRGPVYAHRVMGPPSGRRPRLGSDISVLISSLDHPRSHIYRLPVLIVCTRQWPAANHRVHKWGGRAFAGASTFVPRPASPTAGFRSTGTGL